MNERKIWRFSSDGPFIEVGPDHIKLAFDKKTFMTINAGGITTQGKMNHQGSATDTSYYGLLTPQNELLGATTMSMFSAPQYLFNPALFAVIPDIIGLARSFSGIGGL